MTMPRKDRIIVRELAAQVAEIAALPAQRETIALWKALNGLKPVRPMVMIDQVCWQEMNVDDELTVRAEDEFCRRVEERLRLTLYAWRHMRGDMVVDSVFDVGKVIRNSGFGIEIKQDLAFTDPNGIPGHAYHDQLQTEADIEKIRDPVISLDAEATARTEAQARELLDGILEVRVQGAGACFNLLDWLVQLHPPEALLFDMVDRPEFVHRLIARVTQAHTRLLDQLESQGLLTSPQPTVHCTGAWTDELPAPGYDPARPRARDLWTFGMSQIFSTVSPAMHEEFELPYLGPLFDRFGLVYYGCCEPLDGKMDMVRKLPRVRKVSMSPWVDVERGAAGIGRDFVFSRKPSPAFLAVDDWNPAAVEADLRQTLEACARHGCAVELILKDISTVRYQPRRLWEWAEIATRLARDFEHQQEA